MQTFIPTLQENIFDIHHLVNFPMTVDNITVAKVPHSASMTHTHTCIILLLINLLINYYQFSSTTCLLPCFIDKKFPAAVATVKCPSDHNNCVHSYNSLTFNGRISHNIVTQCTKTDEIVQC